MITYTLTIPYSEDLWLQSWEHICFGIKKGFLKEYAAVLHACSRLQLGHSSERIIELAGLSKDENVWTILNQICQQGHTSDKIKKSWALILLEAIYRDRDIILEPLSLVEWVYSELDYPEVLRPFLPTSGLVEGETIPHGIGLENYIMGKISVFLDA